MSAADQIAVIAVSREDGDYYYYIQAAAGGWAR
jgi:hypothetical protein